MRSNRGVVGRRGQNVRTVRKASAMVQFRTQRVGHLSRFMPAQVGNDEAEVRICAHIDCHKPIPSSRRGRFCHSHKTRKLCATDGCEHQAKWPSPWCWMHADKAKCPVDACERYQQWGLTTCLRHSTNRCDVPGCDSPATPPSKNRCVKHGGAHRCQSEACAIYDVPQPPITEVATCASAGHALPRWSLVKPS